MQFLLLRLLVWFSCIKIYLNTLPQIPSRSSKTAPLVVEKGCGDIEENGS